MKLTTFARIGFVSALLPVVLCAQSTPSTSGAPGGDGMFTDRGDTTSFERQPRDREFMIGGSGATNKDFDESLGGVSFSYGSYLNDVMVLMLRQSITYSNPSAGGTEWNGSTKLAFDYHLLDRDRWRPFIGVNGGRIYGESVRDTWAAGLETGVKYYVAPRTFIAVTIEYGWLFQHSSGVEDRFDDGQWNWSVGVGFNF